jgi:hypothetical protein
MYNILGINMIGFAYVFPLNVVCQVMFVTDVIGNNLHETHYYGLFARDVSDMGYQPGVKLLLVYLRSLHICKAYHINAKYIIHCFNKHYLTHNVEWEIWVSSRFTTTFLLITFHGK